MKKTSISLGLVVVALLMTGCKKPNSSDKVKFTYADTNFTDTLGSRTNNETFNYESIIVNPVTNLRDDFAMGVDASMVKTVEDNGGIYYNQDGVEQDVFQIMARNGVNFFRVRIWNTPNNLLGKKYGGGSVNTAEAIAMSKRAKAAGMNVLVDLHYSDFWADPENQRTPTKWVNYDLDDLITQVEQFTAQTLNSFKDQGVQVEAIQIGNEINNGILYPLGKFDWSNAASSYAAISRILKAGIAGAKSVMPNIYTMIHLANGGTWDVFNSYFTALDANNVGYDLIGASYYPYYHGTLEELKHNLDNVALKFKKPVIVAETSYGFTGASHAYASNIYNTQMEDTGKYITSTQGQATAIRDIVQILADVPSNLGLGIFYWEPAWLPVDGAGWATAEGQAWTAYGDANDSKKVAEFTNGKATWSNQALFSYNGRMLPSLQTFKLLKGNHATVTEAAVKVRSASIDITLNSAAKETLPTTYLVETNHDAIRSWSVVWNASQTPALSTPGTYVIDGVVLGTFNVTANVTVIQNFVVDPSFEKQGSSDEVITPWVATSTTHSSDPNQVVKLNRKAGDVLNGTTNLNWYHYNQVFAFKVTQDITLEEAGSYTLSAFVMAVAPSEIAHNSLNLFVIKGTTKLEFDYKNIIKGWGTLVDYYVKGEIANFTVAANEKITIGIEGNANPGAWGHADVFTLVRN